jgi:hypothetical protein
MPETYRPTNGTGLQSASSFREATMVGKEFFMDKPIITLTKWNRRNYANANADAEYSMLTGTGHTDPTEINSSGISAAILNAAAEGFGVEFYLPPDLDTAQAINFRVLFCDVTDAAGTGDPIFTILYKAVIAGTTAQAVPTTALDTIITATTNVAQYVPVWTAWGEIAAATSGIVALTPGDDKLILKVTVTDLDGCTDVNPLAVQVRYSRKYYNGGAM